MKKSRWVKGVGDGGDGWLCRVEEGGEEWVCRVDEGLPWQDERRERSNAKLMTSLLRRLPNK